MLSGGRFKASVALGAMLFGCGVGHQALASDAVQGDAPEGADAIGEILVTATKVSERLQDVPVTISAASGETLAKRGLVKVQDLGSLTSNLQITSAYGDIAPNFNLRGIGVANEFNSNVASPVGVYVDEDYLSFRASHGLQMYDIERVEVVKGPQGTLYGRNTTGGAINFITTKPNLDGSRGYLTGRYGNFSRWEISGAFEETLVPDKLGFRLSAVRRYGDGWQKNRTPNARVKGDYSSVDFTAARLQVRLKPTENIDLLLKGYTGRSDPNGTAVTADTPGGTDFFGYSRQARGLRNDEYEVDNLGKSIATSDGISLTAAFDLGDISLTSISAYDKGKYINETDCDGTPSDQCSADYDSRSEQFNQDFRLTYKGDNLRIIGGAYYGWDKIVSVTNLGVYRDPGLSDPSTFNPPIGSPQAIASGLYNPALPFSAIDARLSFDQERKSYALYSEAKLTVSDQFAITAGLRYTRDDLAFRNGRAVLVDAAGIPRASSIPFSFPYNPNAAPVARSGTTNRLTGRFIAEYKPNSDAMLYASYSRGYRAGSFNGLAYTDASQIYLVAPETVNAFEAGFKLSLADRRLQVNGAGFFYDYKNQQVQTCNQGAVCSLGGANARVYGFDLDILAKPADWLALNASLGAIDSAYRKGALISGRAVGGNPLPFAPKLTFTGGFDARIAELSAGDISANMQASYTGKFFYEPFDGVTTIGTRQLQTGYWLINARLAYDADRFSIGLWAKNLLNKTYYPFGLDQNSFLGMQYLIRGEPRTYGVEATVRF